MARNEGYRKKVPAGYELGYDANGNVVLVPSTPEPKDTRSPFSRISEGVREGYGTGPITGPTPEEFAKYPIASTIAEPFSMGFNALKRVPGAIVGGLAGTAGAGAQLWTGDRGTANEAENAARSAMEYFASKGMAEPGMTPSGRIPRNGELFPPESGAQGQVGYRGSPIVDNQFAPPPGAIRGTSAEGAPRLAAPNPLAQYRLAGEQGQRVGPNRPSEAFRPMVDQMYTLPEELNRRSEVVTEPTAAQRLATESPQADQALALARKRAQVAEARFLEEQQARATGEGMRERPGTDFNMVGSSYDPTGRSLQPVYTGRDAISAETPRSFLQQQGNLPATTGQGFNAPTVAQGRGMTLSESPGGGGAPRQLGNIWDAEFTPVSAADELAFRAVRPQTLSREELLAMRGPEQGAMSSGTPHSGSYLPPFAGTVLAGTALLSGSQQAQDRDRVDRFAQIYGTTPQSAGAGRGFVNEQPGERFAANAVGSGRGSGAYLPNAEDRKSAAAANALVDARARMSASSNQRAPIDLTSGQTAASPGFLSKIFSGKDYQSANALSSDPRTSGYSAPVVQDGRVNWGSSDSAADFFRADKALSQMKAQQAVDAASGVDDNRKRGGSVTGKSQGQSDKPPDPIHKALEIIHHLLSRH
ncbi:hypothetical protein UFOVP231_8 [uncultured Caudovirales phage]|uniref:Uncharacterized protein n=1 Tax=uncultured Caudovirales phage TaxID=2100421 RepID=A0A6J7WQ50_9CAUD|nr:hypothetical protein UFOVP231_8 [uncultured Caudovirales phage]